MMKYSRDVRGQLPLVVIAGPLLAAALSDDATFDA